LNKIPGVANPKFLSLNNRLKSYGPWPPALKQHPEDLAKAGFYYCGVGDRVKCFACDGSFSKWKPEWEPWAIHIKRNPKCPHVVLMKGTIDKILPNTKNQDTTKSQEFFCCVL